MNIVPSVSESVIRKSGAQNKRPEWLKVRLQIGPNYRAMRSLTRDNQLHTVCEEARCPNIYECWENRSAALMILGDVCTRSCGFCSVRTGRPSATDRNEPERVAEAVAAMGLRHCVLTSVDRDDLPDGGAAIWAQTIAAVRRRVPDCTIEVLTPDFKGDAAALERVFDAAPDIFAHNLETVPRLSRKIRPQASYDRSLQVLQWAADAGLAAKTGIMLGLGETGAEILWAMEAAHAAGCTIFTIGQYLQPAAHCLPVERFVPPEEFEQYRRAGIKIGFQAMESGPLVRSSYHADRAARAIQQAARQTSVSSGVKK